MNPWRLTVTTASIFALVAILAVAQASGTDPGIAVGTDVPYGNVANVSVRRDGCVAEVRFTPDPHGGPECLWFCFRVCRQGWWGGVLGALIGAAQIALQRLKL